MTKQTITIEVQNKELLDTLHRVVNAVSDMRPVMASIGQELEKRTRDRFETETNPNGQKWAPWAESYDPAKGGDRPTDGNTTILDLYGDMLDSLNWQTEGDNTVLVGFGKDYATYHEYGTKSMRRRSMLFAEPERGTLGDDDEEALLDLLNGYLSEAING